MTAPAANGHPNGHAAHASNGAARNGQANGRAQAAKHPEAANVRMVAGALPKGDGPLGVVLLTGVTGFLGKVVLEELLRRDELGVAQVILPIRARGQTGPQERFEREVVGSPCFSHLPPGWTARVRVVAADLEQTGLGLAGADRALRGQVTHIIHSAASVSFDLPVHEAARSNILTSLNVLAFAKECPNLRRLVAVSTAYVTPASGSLTPAAEELAPLPRPARELYAGMQQAVSPRKERRLLALTGHPNTYTLTKCIAEHLVLAERGHVPVSIVRPSIISASQHTPFPGWIDSKAGFAGFVVLLGAGHLRAVVGKGESRLDLVPVDAVAHRVIAACQERGALPTIRYAAAGQHNSPTILECWTGIQAFYDRNRVARPPAMRYLGPRDLMFYMHDLVHHGMPTALASMQSRDMRRKARTLRSRLHHVNRAFPYFTSNSFDFQASWPLQEGFDPRAYVDVVCRGVHRHVLRADETQWAMAGAKHPGHGGDLRWSLRQPHGNAWIRTASWVVTKVLRKTHERITVDVPSFERAQAEVAPGSALVLVATHRSYLDFILVSYLAFARPDLRLPIPHIAATMEFGKIPVLGRILKAMHAFYLRRGTGKEDPDLTRRIHELVDAGQALEFFIEGSRSRTREFLPPKRGLLRALQATGRPVTLLPIALSYDRVPEERAFAQELAGGDKPKMRLGALAGWTWKAMRGKVRLGRAHIACGQPVVLEPGSDVPHVAAQVMDELRAATVATTFHVEAYLRHADAALTPAALRQAITQRGGKVLDSPLAVPDDLDPAIAAGMGQQFLHHFAAEPGLPVLDVALQPPVRVDVQPRARTR